ncbi:beta-ketoacyl synthase N-terminal-like domain-containing protein [Salegentibacter chungangensis]|uniref:Beta-ketoacyl synthase N-terminal-like domain-containing protein n=1 Tax=Salegentibacter chungangensis TaxID=1335724 RepID=A0ABW3NQ73_9FLAO
MKNKIYIHGMGNISAQPENAAFSGTVMEYRENIIPAIDVDYKQFIKPSMLRRMSKAVKMSLAAGQLALEDAGLERPEMIITGTGEGCKQDTEIFLERLLDQNEELLTPTSFIHSTHNTIGGQIALALKCTGYNMTYTQSSCSIESAFLDAKLQFLEDDGTGSILIGGVEEIAEKTSRFGLLDGQIKKERTSNLDLLNAGSEGSIVSEGAQFFAVSGKKQHSTYAVINDIQIHNSLAAEETESRIASFLKENNLAACDLDAVMLGRNGDAKFDHYYKDLQEGMFKDKVQLAFKHLSGEYNTASGYAINLVCKMLKSQTIPEVLKLNEAETDTLKHILIYNQYLGKNHVLILLSAV